MDTIILEDLPIPYYTMEIYVDYQNHDEDDKICDLFIICIKLKSTMHDDVYKSSIICDTQEEVDKYLDAIKNNPDMIFMLIHRREFKPKRK